MSKLSHPNIVYLFETMESGSHYYLVSEIASGGDLCTHIKRRTSGRLEERHARKYARQLVSALGHMHSQGIVHRDLKMENIMLDATKNFIKIVDFGLSNFWSPESPLKTHCGSPEYAAPELFVIGNRYGPEVDLWSLGVILYGMVTGRLPFVSPRENSMTSGEKRRKLLEQINVGFSTTHRKALGSLSIDCSDAIKCMLEPVPNKRIGVDSLRKHAWIKGGPKIYPHTFDRTHKKHIIKKLSDILQMSPQIIEHELRVKHTNDIVGMYQILSRHEMTQHECNSSQQMKRISNDSSNMDVKAMYKMSRPHTAKPFVEEQKKKRELSRPKSTPSGGREAPPNGIVDAHNRLRVVGRMESIRKFNHRATTAEEKHRNTAHSIKAPCNMPNRKHQPNLVPSQEKTRSHSEPTCPHLNKKPPSRIPTLTPRRNTPTHGVKIVTSNPTVTSKSLSKAEESQKKLVKNIWINNCSDGTNGTSDTKESERNNLSMASRYCGQGDRAYGDAIVKRSPASKPDARPPPKVVAPISKSIAGYFNSLAIPDKNQEQVETAPSLTNWTTVNDPRNLDESSVENSIPQDACTCEDCMPRYCSRTVIIQPPTPRTIPLKKPLILPRIDSGLQLQKNEAKKQRPSSPYPFGRTKINGRSKVQVDWKGKSHIPQRRRIHLTKLMVVNALPAPKAICNLKASNTEELDRSSCNIGSITVDNDASRDNMSIDSLATEVLLESTLNDIYISASLYSRPKALAKVQMAANARPPSPYPLKSTGVKLPPIFVKKNSGPMDSGVQNVHPRKVWDINEMDDSIAQKENDSKHINQYYKVDQVSSFKDETLWIDDGFKLPALSEDHLNFPEFGSECSSLCSVNDCGTEGIFSTYPLPTLDRSTDTDLKLLSGVLQNKNSPDLLLYSSDDKTNLRRSRKKSGQSKTRKSRKRSSSNRNDKSHIDDPTNTSSKSAVYNVTNHKMGKSKISLYKRALLNTYIRSNLKIYDKYS